MRKATSPLGERLQAIRIARALTQQQLAVAAGVSLSTVSKLEEGAVTRPSAKILLKVVGVLQFDLDLLLSNRPLPTSITDRKLATRTEPKAEIKFVYFDVGGVMVHTESLILHRLAAQVHRPLDKFCSTYFQYRPLLDRGTLTPDEVKILLLLKLNIPYASSARRNLMRDWVDYDEPNLPMHDFAKEVSARYPIGLISNIGKGSLASMKRHRVLPGLPYKVVIESSEIGLIKPEPAMFEYAARKAGVRAAEIFLIDDRLENVRGARAMGWQAVWFKEAKSEESIAKIRSRYF